jgi:hypothetical protein
MVNEEEGGIAEFEAAGEGRSSHAAVRWLREQARARKLREEEIHRYVWWTLCAAVLSVIVGVIVDCECVPAAQEKTLLTVAVDNIGVRRLVHLPHTPNFPGEFLFHQMHPLARYSTKRAARFNQGAHLPLVFPRLQFSTIQN